MTTPAPSPSNRLTIHLTASGLRPSLPDICAVFVRRCPSTNCVSGGGLGAPSLRAMTGMVPPHTQLSSPAHAGDPVRRGFSVLSLTSLDYRVARDPKPSLRA